MLFPTPHIVLMHKQTRSNICFFGIRGMMKKMIMSYKSRKIRWWKIWLITCRRRFNMEYICTNKHVRLFCQFFWSREPKYTSHHYIDDVSNITNLLSYTQRERYYSFNKYNITFVVLETELATPNISTSQLIFDKKCFWFNRKSTLLSRHPQQNPLDAPQSRSSTFTKFSRWEFKQFEFF